MQRGKCPHFGRSLAVQEVGEGGVVEVHCIGGGWYAKEICRILLMKVF